MFLYSVVLVPVFLIMAENNVLFKSDPDSTNNLSQISLLSNAKTNESLVTERMLTSVDSLFMTQSPLTVFKVGALSTVGKYMSRSNALIGFAGTIIGLYWFGQSTATAPKYKTDDIMYKLTNEFSV